MPHRFVFHTRTSPFPGIQTWVSVATRVSRAAIAGLATPLAGQHLLLQERVAKAALDACRSLLICEVGLPRLSCSRNDSPATADIASDLRTLPALVVEYFAG